MFTAKHILVPVDFSPESELACEWAVLIAKENPTSSIELCHVFPGIIAPVGPEPIVFDYARAAELEMKELESRLRGIQRHIPKEIHSACTIVQGSIAPEIERLCKEKAIDLVVMTTHGRKGLSRFLHGSTTEETARLVPCPVLVLHLNRSMKEAVKTGQWPPLEPADSLASYMARRPR